MLSDRVIGAFTNRKKTLQMFLVLLKIKFGEEYQVIRKFQDSPSKKNISLHYVMKKQAQ
jgi:hypothetical protein